jgi:hypothetical protein
MLVYLHASLQDERAYTYTYTHQHKAAQLMT